MGEHIHHMYSFFPPTEKSENYITTKQNTKKRKTNKIGKQNIHQSFENCLFEFHKFSKSQKKKKISQQRKFM